MYTYARPYSGRQNRDKRMASYGINEPNQESRCTILGMGMHDSNGNEHVNPMIEDRHMNPLLICSYRWKARGSYYNKGVLMTKHTMWRENDSDRRDDTDRIGSHHWDVAANERVLSIYKHLLVSERGVQLTGNIKVQTFRHISLLENYRTRRK